MPANGNGIPAQMPDPNRQASARHEERYGDLFFKDVVKSHVTNPRFLRREWLADEVETILSNPECRFVLINAEPGAGKSTFLAQLASDNPSWLVYFIRRDQ